MRPLPELVQLTCRDHFGVYRGRGRWSPPNRCDACPIGGPCRNSGATLVRNHADLDAARELFIAESLAILEGAPT